MAQQIAALIPDNGCVTADGRQWCTTDIGPTGTNGSSADYQTGASGTTFTLSSSGWGAGIAQVSTNAVDSVRYVFTQPVPSDGSPNVEIVARVVSADDNMQAGIMIRESNDSLARMGAIWLSPKINDQCYRGGIGVLGSINMSNRAYMTSSPATVYLNSNHGATRDEAPVWLRIQRKGNDYGIAVSRDGTHWTAAGGGQLATATTELGLFVGGLWNVGSNLRNTAVFDHVRVGPIQQSFTSTWIGASAVADSTDFVSVRMQALYVAPNGNSYKYASDSESGHNLNKINSAGQIVSLWPAWNGFTGVEQGGIAADANHMFLGIRSNTNPESYYVQARNLSTDPITELSIYAPGPSPYGYASFDPAKPALGRIGGLATGNGKVYVSDFDNGLVRTVNATTLVEESSFTFPRAGLLAVDHTGNLWIANQPEYPDGPNLFWNQALNPCDPAQPSCPRVIECRHPNGTPCLNGTTPIKITGINNPMALAVDPNPLVPMSAVDRLLVADGGPDQNIKICTQLTTTPTCTASFGVTKGIFETSGPGLLEVAGHGPRFYGVRGLGVDQTGALYVASSAPHTEIRKFAKNTSGSWNTTSAWSKAVDGLGLEPGAFDPTSDGNDFFTLTQHFTFDTTKTVAGTEWGRKGMTWNPFAQKKDPDRFNKATQVPLIRKIGGQRFMFVLVADVPNYVTWKIYRFVGELAVPCGYIQGHWENSLFVRRAWADTNLDQIVDQTEITNPMATTGVFTFDVDDQGNAWIGEQWPDVSGPDAGLWKAWEVAPSLVNGVPVYHVDTATKHAVALSGIDGVNQIRYDAAHDAMYVYGGKYLTAAQATGVCKPYCWAAGVQCPTDPNAPDPAGCVCHVAPVCHCEAYPVVTRYARWRQGPTTVSYTMELPNPLRTQTQSDDFGGRLVDPACGCSDWGYRSFVIAGDLFFAGELGGSIHVHDGATGVEVNRLYAGPEVSGLEYWPDYAIGGLISAYRRQATGEYLISVTDDSVNRDRQLVFRMPAPPAPPPPTWTPASVQPSAWYTATDVDQSNGVVNRWLDHSGNSRHLLSYAGGQPAFRLTGWGGTQPTLTFGGGQLMHADHWGDPPSGDDAAFTVMAVVRSAAPQNAGIASWWNEFGGGDAWCQLRASGTRTLADLTRLDSINNGQIYTTAQDLGTTPHVIVWRFSPEVAKVTIDGVTTSSPTQSSITAITTDNTFLLGATSYLPSGLLQGDISELVIVPRNLSDADVASFQTYARQTWVGLPVGGVPVNPCLSATGQALPNTTVCDDGNVATVADRCQNGTCVGHAPPAGSPAASSPLVWYSAEDLDVTTTGTQLPQWFDRSSHKRNVADVFVPAQPTFYATAWNGNKPTVTFNGGNVFRVTPWPDPPAGNDTAFSVVAVLRTTASITQGVAAFLDSVGYDSVSCRFKLVGSATVADLTRADMTGASQEVSSPTGLVGGRHVVVWRYSPEAVQVTVDGVTTSSLQLASLAPMTPDTFMLGMGSFFGSDRFTGDLSEIAVIPSFMSDTAVAQFRMYAQQTWGGLP